MKKRIIAICFIIILSLTSAFTYSQKAEAKTSILKIEQILEVLKLMKTDGGPVLTAQSTVTRAQYAQLLANLSSYEGKVAGSINISLFKDVKKTHWAAGYIKTAVDEGWMTGYLDGNFKPNQAVTLQEAVNGIVKILGYQDSDFTGNKISAKMALYASKGLNENISKTQKQAITKTDCMNLFYNTLKAETKEGKAYGSRFDCVFGADGEIDYLGTLNSEMEGPVIAQDGWSGVLSFANDATVYNRNGQNSSRGAIYGNDVVYYSKKLNRIWAYSDKITGTLKEVKPNNISPETIVVAGKEYALESESAIYAVSSYGQFQKGDVVTLLLGKDGLVAGIKSADSLNEVIYGVVLDTGNVTEISREDTTDITTYVKIISTSGQEYTYECENEGVKKGDLVRVNYTEETVRAEAVTQIGLYGKVDVKNLKIGDLEISADIRILDYKDGKYASVPLSRLDGVSLTYGNVLYYARNDKEIITDMILTDGTGDLNTYGIVTGVDDDTESNPLAASAQYYKYQLNDNTEGSFASEDFFNRPSIYEFDYADGKIVGGSELTGITVTGINGLTVQNGNNEFTLSDEAAFYYVKDEDVFRISLSQIKDTKKYKLTAYYDRPAAQGGRVRAIIAEGR